MAVNGKANERQEEVDMEHTDELREWMEQCWAAQKASDRDHVGRDTQLSLFFFSLCTFSVLKGMARTV